MKLAEAANILGVTLEDITLDSLKLSYKRLVTPFENAKLRDMRSNHSYFQINEAYKKLTSVMEGKDNLKGDDQHEIAAFMRMFMDMVGMADADSIPSAMTFGMMFGAHQHNADDWSTDDGEGEYEEEDDEDEEEDDEDDDDRNEDDYDDWPSLSELNRQSNWEPQAKQYSPMNLKDQVALERKEHSKESDSTLNQQKKLKMAKKRAEKRKKQKEKKQKELSASISNDFQTILSLANTSESIERIITHQKDKFKNKVFQDIEIGNVEGIRALLCFSSIPEIPQSILDRVYSTLKQEMPSYYLLHRCVTDFSQQSREESDTALLKDLVQHRIMIADLFLQSQDPMIDLNIFNEAGLTVLHQSVVSGDLEFVKYVIKVINEAAEGRITLNLNTRCRKKGWAPIHYAVEIGNIPALRLLADAGANLLVTAATDRKLTPLELARTKVSLKNSSNKIKVPHPTSSIYAEVERVLNDLIFAFKGKKNEKTVQDTSREQIMVPRKTIDEKVPEAIKKPDASKPVEKKKKKSKKGVSVENGNESDKLGKLVTPLPGESSENPPPVPSFEINVLSRDELVDNLLTMGFPEADCLAAVSRYGTDFDRAISWLCERPSVEKSPEVKKQGVTEIPAVVESQRKPYIPVVDESKKSLKGIQGKVEDDRRKPESQKRTLDESKKNQENISASANPKVKILSKKDIRQKALSPDSMENFPALVNESEVANTEQSRTKMVSPTSSPAALSNNSTYSIPVLPENLYYSSTPIHLPPGISQPAYPHVLVPVYPMTPVLYGPPLVSVSALGDDNSNSIFSDPGESNPIRDDGFIDLPPDLHSVVNYGNNGTELSVGAKPFIPRLFSGLSSSPFMEAPTLSGNESSSNLNSNINSSNFGAGTELLSGLNSQSFLASLNPTPFEPSISGFASTGIWSSSSLHPNTTNSISSPVSFDPFASLSSRNQESGRADVMPGYLSSILSGLDPSIDVQPDPFEFDAARDILPDLDSLLSNDITDLQ